MTLNWTSIPEGDRRLVVEKATAWYVDITFLRRAPSGHASERTYLTGVIGNEWCAVIEVDGALTRIASPFTSEADAAQYVEGNWE